MATTTTTNTTTTDTTSRFVLPGQQLRPTHPSSSSSASSSFTSSVGNVIPGPGTHLYQEWICASRAGVVVVEGEEGKAGPGSVSVIPFGSSASVLASSSSNSTLPTVNSTVLARVTRINPRQATVEILVVGDKVCAGAGAGGGGMGWQGLIRAQDVRATEKDRVKMVECFRPGDLVRGVVISLGDQSNYYLSTASNNFGVIMATSDDGNNMFPVSWREFRDPVTGKSEARKVAKPF